MSNPILLYSYHKYFRFYLVILLSNPPRQMSLLTKYVPVLHRAVCVCRYTRNVVTFICYEYIDEISDCFENNVFYLSLKGT